MTWQMKKSGDMVKAILRIKKDLANKSVKIGVMGKADRRRGGKAEGPGENKRPIGNVELAVIHEYGAPMANVPPRSFIYSTIHANRAAYVDFIKALQGRIIRREMDVTKALNLLGMRVANDCKTRISEGQIVQDLAESTIAARIRKYGAGKHLALLASSQLKNSITWVVDGGSK